MPEVKIKPIVNIIDGCIQVPVTGFRVINDSGALEYEGGGRNQEEVMLLDKMRHHSITPTTFESRTFVDGYNGEWFMDTYSFNKYEVLRFGINSFSSTLTGMLTSEGIRLGGQGSSKYSKNPQQALDIKISSLECKLLDKSISLLMSQSLDMVIVDIFARVTGDSASKGSSNDNGNVKMNGSFPDIHSVLLYKNPTDQSTGKNSLIVIDPSNFLFSSHLKNFNDNIYDTHKNLSMSCGPWDIVTLHDTLKIYEAPTGVDGPKHSQYRNCTDCVVKIAFGLQLLNEQAQSKIVLNVDPSQIKACPAISWVSNNTGIDEYIIDVDVNAGPFRHTPRIKQNSDPAKMMVFNTMEKLISLQHHHIKMLKLLGPADVISYKEEIVYVVDPLKDVDVGHELRDILDETLMFDEALTLKELWKCHIKYTEELEHYDASFLGAAESEGVNLS